MLAKSPRLIAGWPLQDLSHEYGRESASLMCSISNSLESSPGKGGLWPVNVVYMLDWITFSINLCMGKVLVA